MRVDPIPIPVWIRFQTVLKNGEDISETFLTKRNYFTMSGPSEGHDGFLVLTTKRLLFFRQNTGYDLLMNLDLTDIHEMTTGGTFMRHIIINGRKLFPVNGKTKTLERLIFANIELLKTPITKRDSRVSHGPIRFGKCSNCGHQNETSDLFCKQCGTEL